MKSVALPGHRLQVLDRGAGTPLLFVHGFPLDHSMWQAQVDCFSQRCRTIVPDLRGFGKSDVHPGPNGMEDFADDLAQLLDALGETQPVVFIGLSLGGYIGWQFFQKYPERVLALVACDTRTVADSPEAAAARSAMIDRVRREGASCVADAMISRLFSPSSLQQQPELVEQMRQVILRTPVEGLAAALEGMRTRPDMTRILEKIDVPTLVMVGEHDVVSPPDEMRQIADKIYHSVWCVVPHSGHLSPLENPTVFNDALTEFLSK